MTPLTFRLITSSVLQVPLKINKGRSKNPIGVGSDGLLVLRRVVTGAVHLQCEVF